MKKTVFILLFMLFATGLLMACSPRGGVSLGAADNGRTIEMKTGETLKVSLEGNPTTGYNWYSSSSNPQVLSQVGDSSFAASSNAMGACGMISLTFQALTAGETSLQLQYKRIWEAGIAPLSTYNLSIIVK